MYKANYSYGLKWKYFPLVKSRESEYGITTLLRNRDQFSFYNYGIHSISAPDKLPAEESVHLAMLQHKNPSLIVKAISNVVHKNSTVEEALEILEKK